jgi:hypothetical protein
LTDKLKTLQSRSPTVSKTHVAKAEEHSPLPSRKQVESDRPRQPVPPAPPAKKSLNKKIEESKQTRTPLHESKTEKGPIKRKTPPPSFSVDVNL